MYSKNNTHWCGNGWCHPKCRNLDNCCNVCGSSGVTKGLVQSLREKLICLQNESLQFPKGPIKKKHKDYYCLMLRKINMLDKKLQNLEDLLLYHLDHGSEGRINNEDNCYVYNYLDFYHSVRSLIELVNKLKEDIIYKQNDKHCSDQNMYHFYDRIQTLESELQDLSIYLDQLQNVEEKMCDPNKQTARARRCTRESISSLHRKVFRTEHKELTPNYIKYNVKSKVQITKSNDKHLNENKGKYKNQSRYKNVHSVNYFANNYNHSQSKWHRRKFNANNKVNIGQNENPLGRIQSSRQQSKVFDNHPTRMSSNISICSSDIDEGWNIIYNKKYNKTLRTQYKDDTKNRTEIFNINPGVRNNFQPIIDRSFVQRENRFPIQVKVEEMTFDKPNLQRKSFKNKQTKVTKTIPVRETAGYYYTNSPHTSSVHVELKNSIKVRSDHIIESKNQKPKKITKIPHQNTFETNIIEEISKNKPAVYYSVTPKKYNQYSKKLKDINQNKHSDKHFNRDTIKQEKQSLHSEKGGRCKENYSNYGFQIFQTDYDSLEDLSPDGDFDKHLKREKWYPRNIDDLSSSESEELIYAERKQNHLPFKTNKTAPRISLPVLEKSQNKKNLSVGKHKIVKLYENKEYQEYSKRPHNKVKEEGTELDHNVKNYWQDSHRKTQKKNGEGFNHENREKIKISDELNHSPMYNSESYETIDENEYFSKSYLSHSKIYIDNSLRNNNTDRISEEFVIFLPSNTSSSRSEDTELRQIINALKEFETDICKKCIVTEKRIKLLPHKLTKSKCKGNTKIIIKREIVKCSNCKMKLDKAMLELNNQKQKKNNSQSSAEESPEINNEGEKNKKPESKLPENNDETNPDFKRKPDETIGIINNSKKDIWQRTKTNNIIPTFQAKLNTDNIFHTSHLNDISRNKPLDIPNFGNTININIDRGSLSMEPPPDKSSKSVNIGNIFAKEKTIQPILSDAQIHSKKQSNVPEEKTETNSNRLHSNVNTTNNSRNDIATNISGESKLSDIVKSNTILVANHSAVNHHSTSNSQEKIVKTIEFLDPKDNSSLLFTKMKSERGIQNLQLLLSEKDIKLEDVISDDKSTDFINCSKTQPVLSLIQQKDNEEQTRSIKQTDSSLSKRKHFSHRHINDETVVKTNTVNESRHKPLFLQKEEILSEPDILKIQHHKKISSKDSHYSNRVAYQPASYKKYPTVQKMSKKLKEHLIERKKSNDHDINLVTSKVLDGSVSVLYRCNIFGKDNIVGRKSGTFGTGRRASKQLKNKHTVYPKASSREFKFFISNRKLVGNNKKHPLDNNLLEKTYHKMLNLTMTSESSFSILNWEKVANKLKEDKDFLS